jgi:hypothetical protein
MWRQRIALAVLGLWLAVSVARLSRLVEPAEVPPGEEAAFQFDFLRQTIPTTAGYLFVLPGEFGSDTGLGPRLRYELYPRTYDDIRASQDEAAARAWIAGRRLQYIVVPDATRYAPDHWVRRVPPWLRRIDFPSAETTHYVLEVVP